MTQSDAAERRLQLCDFVLCDRPVIDRRVYRFCVHTAQVTGSNPVAATPKVFREFLVCVVAPCAGLMVEACRSTPSASSHQPFLLVSAKPPVEGLACDPEVPAGLGHVAGHFLNMTDDRQTMIHQSLLFSLRYCSTRSPVSRVSSSLMCCSSPALIPLGSAAGHPSSEVRISVPARVSVHALECG